jgi:hypothetical protein
LIGNDITDFESPLNLDLSLQDENFATDSGFCNKGAEAGAIMGVHNMASLCRRSLLRFSVVLVSVSCKEQIRALRWRGPSVGRHFLR